MFLLLLFLLLVQIAMAMRSAGRRPGGSYNSREMIVNTTLMQEFLFNWQHPMNCRTRKWMAGHIRSSGIGSELHVVSTLFAYAINHEALMIWGPGSMWAEGDNSFDAFFLPITNCTRAMLDPALEIHYHHTDAVRTMVPFPFANQDTYPFPQFYWWRAQAIAYFVQFNPSFQADLNALRRTAFGDRILPCGTICAFIRHGDKGHEMPLLPWSRYWIAIQQTQALIQHIPHHCVRPDFHVFLATDDPQVISDAETQLGSRVMYVTPGPRSTPRVYRESMLNLQLCLEADGFTTQRATNFGRLIDELRITTSKKYAAPFIDADCSQWGKRSQE